MKKRIFCLFLIFAFSISVLSVQGFTQEAPETTPEQSQEENEEKEEKQIPFIGIGLMAVSVSAAGVLVIRKIKGITDEEEKTDSK